MNLAAYARTQAITDATTYRINFDTQSGQVWLTEKYNGVFQPPPNDYGNHMTLKDGMKMQVLVVTQANTQLITDPNVQPQDNDPKPPFGQVVWPSNNVVMQRSPRRCGNLHRDSTQLVGPTRRLVRLHRSQTDAYSTWDLSTSTEVMHLLAAGGHEMSCI